MSRDQTEIRIGIDGGGTGCRVLVGRGDAIPSSPVKGGRANVTTDPTGARDNLVAAVEQALDLGGLDRAELQGARLHFGLAGALDDSALVLLADAFPESSVAVSDDQLTTLTGALGGRDGAIAGIGTGSFIGMQRGNNVRFVGGWGGIISDQASGGWLGRRAFIETVLAHDGLAQVTDLSESLIAHFENDIIRMIAFARDATPSDFATFAPMITAGLGTDPLSDKLLSEGAAYIVNALDTLGFASGERLCLTGGLGPYYARVLPDRLTASLAPAKGTALDGALYLARHPAQA